MVSPRSSPRSWACRSLAASGHGCGGGIPAAAEGAIELDERERLVAAAAGGAVARRDERALDIEQLLEIGEARAILGAGEQGAVARRLQRDRELDLALARGAQSEQRIFDILERGQHRLMIAGERRLGRRLLRAHLRAQPAAVEQGLAEAGEDAAGDRV